MADTILASELDGILAWAVEGLRKLLENNAFCLPRSSCDSVEEFREDSNPVRKFVNLYFNISTPEEFANDPQAEESVSIIFEIFKKFCDREKHQVCSCAEFGRRLTELGVPKRKSNGDVYRGLKFRSPYYADMNEKTGEISLGIRFIQDKQSHERRELIETDVE